MNIESGDLFKVTTDKFLTSGEQNELKRPVKLKKGEIIEIRFPYAWHFRTCLDDQYFHAKEDVILENCEYIGSVEKQIKWENNMKTRDIIVNGLFYDRTKSKKPAVKKESHDLDDLSFEELIE